MLGVKKLISVIAICCMASIAYAEQEIVGAFGVRLGDTVDDSMEFIGESDLGGLFYRFTPAKPNEYFSHYMLLATHKSKKVYEIMASHTHDIQSDCSNKLKLIYAALRNKYGSEFPQRQRRTIFSTCKNLNTYARLEIYYTDQTLAEQSKVEKTETISDSL